MILYRMMSCLAPLFLLLLLVACNQQEESAPGSATPTATRTETSADTATASTNSQGQKIYDSACHSCHSTGVAGAPKLGDQTAWKEKIAKGMDSLVQSTINGKGNMPPKGGDQTLSEDDIRAAVTYMVDQSR